MVWGGVLRILNVWGSCIAERWARDFKGASRSIGRKQGAAGGKNALELDSKGTSRVAEQGSNVSCGSARRGNGQWTQLQEQERTYPQGVCEREPPHLSTDQCPFLPPLSSFPFYLSFFPQYILLSITLPLLLVLCLMSILWGCKPLQVRGFSLF